MAEEKKCSCTNPEYTIELNKQGAPGQMGEKGERGYSPTIDVYKSTNSELVLSISDINGTRLTPNLKDGVVLLNGEENTMQTVNGFGIQIRNNLRVDGNTSVNNLQATSTSTSSLMANSATIPSLKSSDITTTKLTVNGEVTLSDVKATQGNIDNLTSNDIQTRNLEASGNVRMDGTTEIVQLNTDLIHSNNLRVTSDNNNTINLDVHNKQININNQNSISVNDSGKLNVGNENGIVLHKSHGNVNGQQLSYIDTYDGTSFESGFVVTDNTLVAGSDNVHITPNKATREIVISVDSTGGGEGTTDYNDLSNKPSINDITLEGNKTLDELGIQPIGDYAVKDDLPKIATTTTPGIVKPDNSTIVVNEEGALTVVGGGSGEGGDFNPNLIQGSDSITVERTENTATLSVDSKGVDYELLKNLPSLNGEVLIGEMTSEELHLVTQKDLDEKEDKLTLVAPLAQRLVDKNSLITNWYKNGVEVEPNNITGGAIYSNTISSWDRTLVYRCNDIPIIQTNAPYGIGLRSLSGREGYISGLGVGAYASNATNIEVGSYIYANSEGRVSTSNLSLNGDTSFDVYATFNYPAKSYTCKITLHPSGRVIEKSGTTTIYTGQTPGNYVQMGGYVSFNGTYPNALSVAPLEATLPVYNETYLKIAAPLEVNDNGELSVNQEGLDKGTIISTLEYTPYSLNLTANNTVGGTTIAARSSTNEGSYYAYKAFNPTGDNYWGPSGILGQQYVELYSPTPINVGSFTYQFKSASEVWDNFILRVSNDGSTYTDVETITTNKVTSGTVTISKPIPGKYIRFYFPNACSGGGYGKFRLNSLATVEGEAFKELSLSDDFTTIDGVLGINKDGFKSNISSLEPLTTTNYISPDIVAPVTLDTATNKATTSVMPSTNFYFENYTAYGAKDKDWYKQYGYITIPYESGQLLTISASLGQGSNAIASGNPISIIFAHKDSNGNITPVWNVGKSYVITGEGSVNGSNFVYPYKAVSPTNVTAKQGWYGGNQCAIQVFDSNHFVYHIPGNNYVYRFTTTETLPTINCVLLTPTYYNNYVRGNSLTPFVFNKNIEVDGTAIVDLKGRSIYDVLSSSVSLEDYTKDMKNLLQTDSDTTLIQLNYDDSLKVDDGKLGIANILDTAVDQGLYTCCVLDYTKAPTYSGNSVTIYQGTRYVVPTGRDSNNNPTFNIVTLSEDKTVTVNAVNNTILLNASGGEFVVDSFNYLASQNWGAANTWCYCSDTNLIYQKNMVNVGEFSQYSYVPVAKAVYKDGAISNIVVNTPFNLFHKFDKPAEAIITQAQYDALTTKDSNTLYFITEG